MAILPFWASGKQFGPHCHTWQPRAWCTRCLDLQHEGLVATVADVHTPFFVGQCGDNMGNYEKTCGKIMAKYGYYMPTPADARGSASRITGFCLCNNNNNNKHKKWWCVAFLRDGGYSWKIRWCLAAAAAAAARPVSFSLSLSLYIYI